jgi:hypothetical protein
LHTVRDRAHEDYFATITSEALITASTSSPSFKPRSATASFVIDAVTVLPPPMSMAM